MNTDFAAAMNRMHARLEAALGELPDALDGSVMTHASDVPSDDIARALIADLFETPEEVDAVVRAFQTTALVIIASIGAGCNPPSPIVGALAQMLATGYFYGQTRRAGSGC